MRKICDYIPENEIYTKKAYNEKLVIEPRFLSNLRLTIQNPYFIICLIFCMIALSFRQTDEFLE